MMKKIVLMLGMIFYSGVVVANNPSGTCGTNCNWTIENGVLKVSGGIDGSVGIMEDYTWSEKDHWTKAPWFEYKENITGITVSGVENIGKAAFAHLPITSVSFDNSLLSIGEVSFYGNRLKTINIPDSVNTLNWAAFYGSYGNIIVPATVEGIDGRIMTDSKSFTVTCRGSNEECQNIYNQLSAYIYYDHANKVWKIGNWVDLLKQADENQCNSAKYYWTGGLCNNRPTDGSMIECDEGWYATNKDVCEKIKLRYTLPEADEATSDDNENTIEWIFE